jgi:hypothetical protein
MSGSCTCGNGGVVKVDQIPDLPLTEFNRNRNMSSRACATLHARFALGISSNGRTADSGSVNGGSTPSIPASLARSSSGLGRRPLKAEIASSNLARATISFRREFLQRAFAGAATLWRLQCAGFLMARSSSGLGRRPLKAEIASSNLARATNANEKGRREQSRRPFLLAWHRHPVEGCDRQ